jgi:pyrroline-5-carboxylate reductase
MARLDPHILADGTLWIIGCGNMGRAMLDRWIACGLDPARVTVIDPALPAIGQGITVLAAPNPDAPPPGIAILAVKPQMLDAVAATIVPQLGAQTLLISILAGVSIAALRKRFAAPANIARAMPNLPVAIGAGVVALYGVAGQPEAARLEGLMVLLGATEWLGEEAHFDVVTALSGSGPAFVARFIAAMAAGGAALGLSTEQARTAQRRRGWLCLMKAAYLPRALGIRLRQRLCGVLNWLLLRLIPLLKRNNARDFLLGDQAFKHLPKTSDCALSSLCIGVR